MIRASTRPVRTGPRPTTAGAPALVAAETASRACLPLALKAVIGLVVLAAFLTLADRWALLYAEHAAADKLEPGGVEGRKPRKGAGAAGQQPVNRTQFTAPSRFHQRRLRKPGSAVKPHTCGCGGVLIPCGPLKPTRRQ